MNRRLYLILILTVLFLNHSLSQDEKYDTKAFYFPDKIANSKFKKGYTKGHSKVPAKYRKKVEEDDFFGGEGYVDQSNFDLNLLLSKNRKHVRVPTNSFIVFEFEKGLKDFENSIDLIIEGCTRCACGKRGRDSALISVSTNNMRYTDLLIVKDYQYHEIDFKKHGVDDVKFIKVQGLSAINHPYGYGLMNIYGFHKPPTKLVEPTTHVLETKEKKKEVIIIQDMLFEFNDSLIKNEEQGKLDSICKILALRDFDSLIVSGHTDSVGNAEYNLKLSLARAKTIANYLVACGIKRRKLNVIGFGETKLLDNISGDDSGNRRVEIEIIYDE